MTKLKYYHFLMDHSVILPMCYTYVNHKICHFQSLFVNYFNEVFMDEYQAKLLMKNKTNNCVQFPIIIFSLQTFSE